MPPKRAAPPKPPAAAAPSSSTEEDGDTSSSDSTTSHEREVSAEEREEKESEAEAEEGESESESSEEEWAAAAEVDEDEEESTEEGDDGGAGPDLQPPSKRVDFPVTAAKNQPQSNKSPALYRKRASSEIGKSTEPKSKRIRRVWAPSDEVLILVALAQHRRQHGELPAPSDRDFFDSLRERLEDNSCHHSDIKDKIRSLLRRYKSRVVLTTDHDRRLQNLSKDVWGDPSVVAAGTGSINGNKQADGVHGISGAENGGGQSDTKSFKEMCGLYPLLAQEVKLLAEVHPGLESSLTRLDAKRALDIEKKLERVKNAELKIEARMVVEVHAPKAKISKKLVSLLAKVSKNV